MIRLDIDFDELNCFELHDGQNFYDFFDDPQLAAAVARALRTTPDQPVTIEQLQSVSIISASWANIFNLNGIENLTGLRELNLFNNNVSDLSPIRNLTGLRKLYMYNNNITDISPIANLTMLDDVHLSTNMITNISAIDNLTRLDYLNLTDNTIRDISPLSNLPVLRKVELGNNNISDVSSFASSPSSRLEFFSVENTIASHIRNDNLNSVSDISPIGRVPNLYARFQRIVLPNGRVNQPTKFILRNRNNNIPTSINFVRGNGVINNISLMWTTSGQNELSWSDPTHFWFTGTVTQSVAPDLSRP